MQTKCARYQPRCLSGTGLLQLSRVPTTKPGFRVLALLEYDALAPNNFPLPFPPDLQTIPRTSINLDSIFADVELSWL